MMKVFEKHGQSINYIIIRKPIKNTYFRVKDHFLQITTNRYTTEAQIISFIDQKFDVFVQKISAQSNKESDQEITLWHEKYVLKVIPGRFSYAIFEKTIHVQSNLKSIEAIKKKIYHLELEKKLQEILPDIHQTISMHQIDPMPMKLKYLKSKYGSYHRKHQEITLNTYLSRLKPIYLTYVIYHEYAHRVHFNHSKAFYNVLDHWMPNHKNYQKDLKKIAIL